MKLLFNNINNKGFTLFELVVAIFVFSIVSIIASGAFVQTLRFQRLATNTQFTEEGARFILESMAREIRVANVINDPDNGCLSSSPVSSLTIDHPVNGIVTYDYDAVPGTISRTVQGDTAVISSDNVLVTRLDFYCLGTAAGDNEQPRVTIVLSLEAGKGRDTATIDVQTTLSQRRLSN